jgi:hypothetical protein
MRTVQEKRKVFVGVYKCEKVCVIFCHKAKFKQYQVVRSCGSSVSIVTRLQAGWLGFDSWQGLGIFLFVTASRPALGPYQPAIQWMLIFPMGKLVKA